MKITRPVSTLLLLFGFASVICPTFADDEKKITISGNDQMKYDVTAFDVVPEQKVTLTITNVGKLPKVAMAHNFVLLKPGTDVAAFAMAGMSHAADDYIAPEMADKVIAHTKMAGPGESQSVTFTAPAAGAYDYICTFPAHATVGMHGVMTVK